MVGRAWLTGFARLTGWRLDITSDSEAAEARARYLAEREAVPEVEYAEDVPADEAVAETEETEGALTIDDELLRALGAEMIRINRRRAASVAGV